ncbi:hypothetical protein SAY87_011348 [Trapa incisa]|uniref:Uncharacterized protein n=1 Tax=Trapa incisa TaxID=236973 RepID=A0AAN7GJ52_9MYRT|nr:hypothetical protein SAY87_011348 [Trapa incisa]
MAVSVAPMQSPSSKGSGLSKLLLAKVVYKSRCDNLNEIVERTSGDKPESFVYSAQETDGKKFKDDYFL